jgi:leader peptidase (prepilin peptidase)/N-methyltransferase
MLYIITFYGLSLGSLISALSYRIPRSEDVFFKPSCCTNCNNKLKARDLIPLFSWLMNHGKCRYCKKKISARYPLIEITTCFMTLLCFFLTNDYVLTFILSFLIVILVTISVIDFEHYIIPDRLQVIFLIYAIFWVTYFSYDIIYSIFSAFLGFFISYALLIGFKYIRNKDGLGFGDVKFIAIAAIFLGADNFTIFFLLSGLFGVLNGLVWQYFLGKKLFPFAPSLCLSLFLCLILVLIFDKSFLGGSNLNLVFNKLIF